jgi:hypothetical protein
MDEVHGPGLVMTCGFTAILPELGLHAPLGWFLPELKAQFIVKSIYSFRIDDPAFTNEEDVWPLPSEGNRQEFGEATLQKGAIFLSMIIAFVDA